MIKVKYCNQLTTCAFIFFSLLVILVSNLAAAPNSFIYNGILTDLSGLPRTGTYTMLFRIYSDSTSSSSLWSETIDIKTDSDGRFSANLGLESPFGADLFDGSTRYLALQLDGNNEMLPRQLISSVPYALNSNISQIKPTDIIGTAAVLDSNQFYKGKNEFSGETLFRNSSTNSAPASSRNVGGGPGLLVTTNSDNSPALLAITGTEQDILVLDNFGTGPIIEGWISSWQAVPPAIIYDRRFVVENNGDVKADGAFFGGGADFAEMFDTNENLEAGDLVVIDESGSMTVHASTFPRLKTVIGIVSAQPGFIGGGVETSQSSISPSDRPVSNSDSFNQNRIPIAISGIVSCKVTDENGAINPGDLLVSSSIKGHAMKAINPLPGTVIGKALTPHLNGQGMIKVLVMIR